MQITLYSKPGCHLCDELRADVLEFQAELGFELIVRNIERNQDDFQRYRYLIPVLDIEGGELLFPPHTRETVRSALYAAYGRVS